MPASAITQGHWFGDPGRPLAGWLSTSEGRCAEYGVVICPPVGYAYWSAHRSLRVLAERLAVAGHTVLRFDYDGTGDSAGDQRDAGRLAAWRDGVRTAVAHLRDLGCTEVVLVGVQLGGSLALEMAAEVGVGRVVAWAPATTGPRFAKQVRMMSVPAPEEAGWGEDACVQAGSVFTSETFADLAGLDPASGPGPAAVLLLGGRAESRLGRALEAAGSEVQVVASADGHQALERPAEEAEVPEETLAAICDWVGPGGPGTRQPDLTTEARFDVPGGTVTERFVRIGSLVAVETLGQASQATVVFLNSGSEPHVGSGRSWVEYARGFAIRGYRVLRTDFRGWGESPDDGFAPGRPYDAHTVDDAVFLVEQLRPDGPVVLAGLCAGAWVALRAALQAEVTGVVALNPQLYWEPGDPVEATMTQTRERRTPERARIEQWRRRGAWTALDVLGHRNWAARWLDDLGRRDVHVGFVFSEADDGLEYLRSRLARRTDEAVRRGLRIREVPKVDHSAQRAWLRDRVLAAISEELTAICSIRPGSGSR